MASQATMHSSSALYYPYIHFKSDAWLKLCALYWERLGRIVPSSYVTKDSPTVKELGTVIETLRPEWVTPEFGETFVEFIAQYSPALSALYAVKERDAWPFVPEESRPPTAGGGSGTDMHLGYVFYEKMTRPVRDALIGSGLALVDPSDERWIGMHPKLARVYMTALADQLAGERGMYPVTDETLDHVLAGGLTIERLSQALLGDVSLVDANATKNEVETTAFEVAVRMALPTDLDHLPVERILRFRETSARERGEFRAYVAKFVAAREWLTQVRDRATLEERLRSEYETELAPKLADLRTAMEDAGIASTLSAMSIRFAAPVSLSTLAAALGFTMNPFISFGVGGVLAATRLFQDHRKKTDGALRKSPAAYLFRVERDLAPAQVARWVGEQSRAFMLG